MGNLATLLRLVPDDDAETACLPDPEPDAPPALAVVLRGGRVSLSEQAQAAAWQAWRAALLRLREASRRDGGLLHAALTYRGPSYLDQDAYAKSRVWVPAGHDGGFADKGGGAYHKVIGKPAVAVLQWMIFVFARPLRLSIALFVLAVLALAAFLLFA